MINLQGHTAIITGGTQGVGSAIAKSLAAAGCDLILQGLQENDHSKQTIQECSRHQVQIQTLFCDLTQPIAKTLEQIDALVDSARLPVDFLVNNVGVFIDQPFLEMNEQTFDTTFHLNVKLGYFLTQAFAKRWIVNKTAGRVVFTGSINGLLAEPNHSCYDASKAAIAGMVRSLCVTLAPHNIRVNSMAPGLVRTPLTNQSLSNDAEALEWMQLHTPSGQVPEADVCGGTVAFLLSDLASHIHGQTIYVDGGMSAWQQPDYRVHE